MNMICLIERYHGITPTQGEIAVCFQRAVKKLLGIIEREGDANGSRHEPWYIAMLLGEEIEALRLSKFYADVSASFDHEKRVLSDERESTP